MTAKIIIKNAFRNLTEEGLLFFSCKILEGTISAIPTPLLLLFKKKKIIIKIKHIESISQDSLCTLNVEVIEEEVKIHEVYGKEILVTLSDSALLHPRLQNKKLK